MNRNFSGKYSDLIETSTLSEVHNKVPASKLVKTELSGIKNELGDVIDIIIESAKTSTDRDTFMTNLYDTLKNSSYVNRT